MLIDTHCHLNMMVKKTADLYSKSADKYKCEKHPDFDNVVTIKADLNKTVIFEKTSFCCDEFANSIKFDVKA